MKFLVVSMRLWQLLARRFVRSFAHSVVRKVRSLPCDVSFWLFGFVTVTLTDTSKRRGGHGCQRQQQLRFRYYRSYRLFYCQSCYCFFFFCCCWCCLILATVVLKQSYYYFLSLPFPLFVHSIDGVFVACLVLRE